MEDQDDNAEMAVLTADIVAAYVGNNVVPVAELPNLIQSVHGAISAAAAGFWHCGQHFEATSCHGRPRSSCRVTFSSP